MSVARSAVAIHPRPFGRRSAAGVARAPQRGSTADLKLFATTFAGGFLFMAIFFF